MWKQKIQDGRRHRLEGVWPWEWGERTQGGSSFCTLKPQSHPNWAKSHRTARGKGWDLSLSDKATAGDPTSLSDPFSQGCLCRAHVSEILRGPLEQWFSRWNEDSPEPAGAASTGKQIRNANCPAPPESWVLISVEQALQETWMYSQIWVPLF